MTPVFGPRHDAAWAVHQRMNARLCEFIELVGEYEAPAIYWLESDCGESYCREHAIAARAEEFGLGIPLEPDHWYRRTELEEVFFEGLSSSPYGLESDNSESCATCGKTLVYSLTDYGTTAELDHFDTVDWSRPCPPEVGYELDRAVCNTFHSESRPQLVKACRIVAQAWRAALGSAENYPPNGRESEEFGRRRARPAGVIQGSASRLQFDAFEFSHRCASRRLAKSAGHPRSEAVILAPQIGYLARTTAQNAEEYGQYDERNQTKKDRTKCRNQIVHSTTVPCSPRARPLDARHW